MNKLLTSLFLLLSLHAFGQGDTVKLRRNTIKLDITSRWLYRQAFVLSYERVLNHRRSFAIIAGYQNLPETISLGNGITVTRDTRATGFKLGGEYRFYLAKENKYPAPRGVYLGPYVSLNNFHNEREITVDNGGTPGTAQLNSSINVLNMGVQLGYQFVFNDRWSVDLSFLGPALAYYSARLDLTGSNINPDEIASDILNDLINRFPGLGDLIDTGTVKANGTMDAWSAGLRYQIQVGYRFGKKK
jgi:hypothetical protein